MDCGPEVTFSVVAAVASLAVTESGTKRSIGEEPSSTGGLAPTGVGGAVVCTASTEPVVSGSFVLSVAVDRA